MATEGRGGIRRAVDYRIDARVRQILLRELGGIIRGGKILPGALPSIPGGAVSDIVTDETTGDIVVDPTTGDVVYDTP